MFISLMFLKDGLPPHFHGSAHLYKRVGRLKDYYRSPGYGLLLWGILLHTIGLAGQIIIWEHRSPGVLSWLPLDYLLIGLGIICLIIAYVWVRPRAMAKAPTGEDRETGKTINFLRGPGYNLPWIGLLWLVTGAMILVFARLV
jgi:hypothetical protein